jgi:FixJ family two-component response regulator
MKYILIDDDKLIRLSWIMAAQKACVDLQCFETVHEFINSSDQIIKGCKIFIDSDLGEGVKGEFASKDIKSLGFDQIYITTGYLDLDLKQFPWIKGLVTKKPMF